MLKRSTVALALLLTVVLVVSGFSCNPPPTQPAHKYVMSWDYDCDKDKIPASFDYGYVTVSYQSLGTLLVNSCSGNQSFTVTQTSNKIPAGSTFYVRAFYNNPVAYGPVSFYKQP